MRQKLIVLGLFMIGGILVMRPTPTTQVQAQGDTVPDDGCDAGAVEVLVATTEVIDYRAACDVYVACDPAREGDPLCQFSVFQVMLAQCPPDDRQCHDGAILFAAAIFAYEHLFSGENPPQTVIDGVPLALTAYWQGDEAGALFNYELTLPEDFYDNLALPLSRAVLYQRLNQPALALAEYDFAFGVVFDDPLLYYARSQLYAELGRTEEAAFDVAALATYTSNDPAFAEWVVTLQAQYPLDEPGLTDWLYYPVSRKSFGPGGGPSDLSLMAPHPVQLAVSDVQILAIGLKNFTRGAYDVHDTIPQLLRLSEDGSNFLVDYPAVWENSGTLTLTPLDGGYMGREAISVFEGGVTWDFMLAPADAPDPRLTLDASTRYCEGGVRSQLAIGAVVTTVSYSGLLPLLMTDTPAGEVIGQIERANEGYITVVGGPECAGSVTWWEGYHTDGTRGWFTENEDTLYVALPTHIPADALFCEGAAPLLLPRLIVGEQASVVENLGANNVRSEPSVEAELVGSIPPSTDFEIIGGPVCLEDTVWWYADYDGLVGWTVEGEASEYWLAPVE